MGRPNIVTKDYMQDPQHFADAFNYYAFDGRQVVQAEKLSEADPTELAIIFSEGKKEFAEKFRDVLKQCILKEDDKFSYLMLGIENQTDIHSQIYLYTGMNDYSFLLSCSEHINAYDTAV